MNAMVAALEGAAPTLELRQFAVRSAGPAWAAPLSLRSTAQRVALVGDWDPLFQVLSGRAEVASGEASILGNPLESAISGGILGFAACDPPLPGSFTVNEYLVHAARLIHGSLNRARQDAQRTLERYGLVELTKRKLAELVSHQRRALGIALATLTAPPVVCLETPLRGLDAPSADYIARLCGEAAAHSRLVLSSNLPASPSPERSLLDTCDDLFVVARGELLARGAPSAVFAASSRYTLCVTGDNIAAYASALGVQGVRVEARTEPGRFHVELPQTGTESSDVLLDTALEQGVIIVELEPLLLT